MAIAAGIKIQKALQKVLTSFFPHVYGGSPFFTHLTNVFNFSMLVPDIICHISITSS